MYFTQCPERVITVEFLRELVHCYSGKEKLAAGQKFVFSSQREL
jgi:hypothetical protein